MSENMEKGIPSRFCAQLSDFVLTFTEDLHTNCRGICNRN